MNIFERLKSGEPIHMIDVPEYHAVAHKEMDRCRKLCFQINHTLPDRVDIHPLEKELFTSGLSERSYFTKLSENTPIFYKWVMNRILF